MKCYSEISGKETKISGCFYSVSEAPHTHTYIVKGLKQQQ